MRTFNNLLHPFLPASETPPLSIGGGLTDNTTQAKDLPARLRSACPNNARELAPTQTVMIMWRSGKSDGCPTGATAPTTLSSHPARPGAPPTTTAR